MHTDNEALLTSHLEAETKARTSAVTAEAKAREDADAFLQAQVGGLWGGFQTIEARDSALDGVITQERTRALTAEGVVQANLDAEAKARADADSKLSDRIDFIVSNTNPSAIDSLSEIVAQFSQNGKSYASRLSYLEAVVSALVAKTQ